MLYSESSTNDYVRSPPTPRKTQPFFKPKRGVTKSTNRDKNESLTFDDLHQMTLIGLHATQYMYILFGKVHISIHLILHWRVTFSSSKTCSDIAESHMNSQKYSKLLCMEL